MDKFDFTHNGMQFRCEVSQDCDMSPPWEEHDGHGIIRVTYSYYGHPEKAPGERIIHTERDSYWIYDVAETMKMARRDAWGCGECTPNMSPGQRAACAVDADIRYCRDWLRGERWWAQIEVYPIDAEGERSGDSEFLGGIDSGFSHEDNDYLRECACELADQIHHARLQAWRKALHETRQRRYWESRDVATVGA